MQKIDDRRTCLVFEGGGSSGKATIGEKGDDTTWTKIARPYPSNIRTAGRNGFTQALSLILKDAGLSDPRDISKAVFCVAGVDFPSDIDDVLAAVRAAGITLDSKNIQVGNDMEIGIIPFSNMFRGVVISGTGMNAGARVDGFDHLLVGGGTGPLLSDARGAGAGLGLRAVQFASDTLQDAAMLDPRKNITEVLSSVPTLTNKIMTSLGCSTTQELIDSCYPGVTDTSQIIERVARAAKVLAEEAMRDENSLSKEEIQRGDLRGIAYAREALAQTGEFLAARLSKIVNLVEESGSPVTDGNISLIGSVISGSGEQGYLYRSFRESLGKSLGEAATRRFTFQLCSDTFELHRAIMRRL